ncbi:MAG TPA: hypothetical protein VMN36_05110 [Verrucomicrobiales bacterium]|nr:hypothetical protein [Verrucomicrobiales bacterium]
MPGDPPQPPVYWVPYTLRAPLPPSRRSSRHEFPGALIRTGSGFGCIHPWPELGDLPLRHQLAGLADGILTPLSRRALACAAADGGARNTRCSLFDGLTIPESHATLPNPSSAALDQAHETGFQSAKCKAGPGDIQRMRELLRSTPLPLRIDFNETLNQNDLDSMLSNMDTSERARIEFLEDPFPFDARSWTSSATRWNLTFAVDRDVEAGWPSAGVAVLKPALQDTFLLAKPIHAAQRRAVVTSYLDHPLGQLFAAWQAARIDAEFPGLLRLCGLATHTLFERTAFSELLPDGPRLTPAPGTGLGFDDLLERLPWKRLN